MAQSPGLPFDDDRAVPLSVSELTADLKQVVEQTFGRVLVEGEISNCKQWSSGHIYFTLKDDRAQIRAVMFRMTARMLRWTGPGSRVTTDLFETVIEPLANAPAPARFVF